MAHTSSPHHVTTTESSISTMRAAVIVGPHKLDIVRQALPKVGPHDVRIRVEGCGICASNSPVWEGRSWFEYPRSPGSPGHEAWGTVDAIGIGVTNCVPGDRVAALSYHGFAEYDVASEDHVVVLPSPLADRPALGEPLGCAANVFRRSDIQLGQSVVIVGIGFLGSLLTQLASQVGAEVIAVSRRPWALEMAQRCGAKHTVPLTDPAATVEQIRQLLPTPGAARVIEAAGCQATLEIAGELVEARGRLIIAGFHQDGFRHVDMQSWNWRGIDVINAHEREPAVYREGMQLAFQWMEEGRLDPQPLITHQFPLDELSTALEMQNERPPGYMKGVILNDF